MEARRHKQATPRPPFLTPTGPCPCLLAENQTDGGLVSENPQEQVCHPRATWQAHTSQYLWALNGFAVSGLVLPCCPSSPVPLMVSMEMKENHLRALNSNPGVRSRANKPPRKGGRVQHHRLRSSGPQPCSSSTLGSGSGGSGGVGSPPSGAHVETAG